MKLKAPFPYFGGSPESPPRFGGGLAIETYVEPFCGSCAVLLAPEAPGREIVNDPDGHIANVWQSVRPTGGRRQIAFGHANYRPNFGGTKLNADY